jgi:hypothetical protein
LHRLFLISAWRDEAPDEPWLASSPPEPEPESLDALDITPAEPEAGAPDLAALDADLAYIRQEARRRPVARARREAPEAGPARGPR